MKEEASKARVILTDLLAAIEDNKLDDLQLAHSEVVALKHAELILKYVEENE